MECFMCKGNSEDKLTNFMVDLNSCILIVKQVPSLVCSQCGEVSYSNEVALQLERVVDSMRSTIAEIAVVNYPGRVA